MDVLKVASAVSRGLLLNGNGAARAAREGLPAVLIGETVKVHLLRVRLQGILLGQDAVDVQQ